MVMVVMVLCVEQSLDPQAEAGVPTAAVKVFIVRNSQRNKLKIASCARKQFNKRKNLKH